MKKILALSLLLAGSEAFAFDTFDKEGKKVSANIGCRNPKISPAWGGGGRLYGCITGRAETVKFFINETDQGGKVKNAKLMWNDYTSDMGEGLHADAAMAKAWASVVGTLYAPTKVDQVMAAFASKRNTTIDGGKHILKYTYSPGPAIDERLITVTAK